MSELELLNHTLNSPHDSSHLHVAGESIYVDDRPLMDNELYVGLFYSPHPSALIKKIDIAQAKNSPGVKCVLTSADLHHNVWGAIIAEQPLMAQTRVNYVGEVIAVVGADSKENLKQALGLIEVEFITTTPILSIDQAVEAQSFIGAPQTIERGNIDTLTTAPHRLKGQLHIHGADHFYLENQSAIAYPLEDNHLEVHSSTQHPTETQSLVAEALGIPFSSVSCIAQRLGGAFGGKETQAAPFAVYAALVAHKTKCPARIVLSKDDDMLITGKRNPYQINYHVGFDSAGKIIALHANFLGDGGAYADLSTSILERALFHADNAYYIPNVKLEGRVCRTNFHPHTAFRGFGGPKGIAMIEHVMEEVGHHLAIDALEVRKINCYRDNFDITPYGQKVENNLLPQLFTTLEKKCDYIKRRSHIEKWNQNPKNNPRGLSLTAIKFGISFTTRFLNQANALVHIFRDGSIQVSTGGVEMGQGVQTRIRTLVSEVFGLKDQSVRIMPTSTDRSTNTSPTAASSGTDLNGAAAVMAAQKIRKRLESIFSQIIDLDPKQHPKHSAALACSPELEASLDVDREIIFRDNKVFLANDPKKYLDFVVLVNAAYLSRVALSDYGFYKTPHLSFNKLKAQGNAFLYFTQGVAASEVEIDQHTGDVKVLRSDILMDLGKPINDALDRGQIAGAFIQGLGWVTNEALYYNSDGRLLSCSPSTYKIPSIHDIPRIFNIDLIKNHHNSVNIRGTKAVGEPPLMLCFSVWNAVKNALISHKKSDRLPCLPIPASKEVIIRALQPKAFENEIE